MWVCLGISTGNRIINHWMECLSLFQPNPYGWWKLDNREDPPLYELFMSITKWSFMVRNWKITHKELGSIPCNTSFEVWGWETKREKYDDKAHGGSSRFPSLATNPQISQTSTCTLPAASWPFFGSLCCNTLSLFKRSTLLGASLLLISSSMHKLNLPVNQIMFESVQGHLN